MIMENKTIAQIKRLFEQNNLTEKQIYVLRQDERKGIQQLLKSYDRQKAKQKQARDLFYTMKDFDQSFKKDKTTLLAGIDEAGRGPLAGPVVSAAVILPSDFECIGLTDSKQLSKEQRDSYYNYIVEHAIDYQISVIDSKEIDELNILEATKKSMRQAIEQLNPPPRVALIDAVEIKDLRFKTVAITKGDAKSISIAAASILAKVYRDRLMEELDEQYPAYDFKSNKGYGSKAHLDALKKYGPSPFHRTSFSPVQKAISMNR